MRCEILCRSGRVPFRQTDGVTQLGLTSNCACIASLSVRPTRARMALVFQFRSASTVSARYLASASVSSLETRLSREPPSVFWSCFNSSSIEAGMSMVARMVRDAVSYGIACQIRALAKGAAWHSLPGSGRVDDTCNTVLFRFADDGPVMPPEPSQSPSMAPPTIART